MKKQTPRKNTVYTLDEYKNVLKTVTQGTVVTLAKDYVTNKTAMRHRCVVCEYTWKAQPASFLAKRRSAKKYQCRRCATVERNKKNALTRDDIESRLHKKFGSRIRMVGQYRSGRRLRFRCYECLNTWKALLQSLLTLKYGCPICAGVKKSRRTTFFKDYEKDGIRVRVQGYEPQALNWIFNKYPHFTLKTVLVESTGKVPVIDYKVGRRNHRYFPDIFIPSQNRIVEVKSIHTLGAKTGKHWKKNQEKAKACLEKGYKFSMLLMGQKGDRLWLPKEWYLMSRKEVLARVAYRYGMNKENMKIEPVFIEN